VRKALLREWLAPVRAFGLRVLFRLVWRRISFAREDSGLEDLVGLQAEMLREAERKTGYPEGSFYISVGPHMVETPVIGDNMWYGHFWVVRSCDDTGIKGRFTLWEWRKRSLNRPLKQKLDLRIQYH
jgi:hypothetical protein